MKRLIFGCVPNALISATPAIIIIAAIFIMPLHAKSFEGEEHYEKFLDAYRVLLERHISPNSKKEGIIFTRVNYGGWALDPMHHTAMVNLRQVADPFSISPVKQMAFWINVYNYLTIDIIITKQEKENIRNLDGVFRNVWQRNKWKIFGDTYTLDQIEHKILRPMNEPRIHYAINCASLSCPDLLNKPYTEKGLFTQLEEQEAAFLNNPTKGFYVEYDADGEVRKVKMSKIFQWYKSDFGGKKGIKELLQNYKGVEKRTDHIYMKYNWKLNGDW